MSEYEGERRRDKDTGELGRKYNQATTLPGETLSIIFGVIKKRNGKPVISTSGAIEIEQQEESVFVCLPEL